jgi:hypothetical protein
MQERAKMRFICPISAMWSWIHFLHRLLYFFVFSHLFHRIFAFFGPWTVKQVNNDQKGILKMRKCDLYCRSSAMRTSSSFWTAPRTFSHLFGFFSAYFSQILHFSHIYGALTVKQAKRRKKSVKFDLFFCHIVRCGCANFDLFVILHFVLTRIFALFFWISRYISHFSHLLVH